MRRIAPFVLPAVLASFAIALSAPASGGAPESLGSLSKQAIALSGECNPAVFHGTARGADVILPRMPSEGSIDASAGCEKDVEAEQGRFYQADIGSWHRLAGDWCSASAGWKEYNPGTCQAGGPPPVCPENHWFKSPDAMVAWKNQNAAVRKDRYKDLERVSCRCKAGLVAGEGLSVGPEDSGLMSCSTGACPDGLTCNQANQTCVAAHDAIDRATAGNADDPMRRTIALMDAASKELSTGLHGVSALSVPSSPYAANQSIADPSGELAVYRGNVRKVADDVHALRDLVSAAQADRARAKAGKDPIHSADDWQTQFATLHAALESSWDAAQVAAQSIEQAPETLGDDQCPELFSAYDHHAARAAGALLALDPTSAGLPPPPPAIDEQGEACWTCSGMTDVKLCVDVHTTKQGDDFVVFAVNGQSPASGTSPLVTHGVLVHGTLEGSPIPDSCVDSRVVNAGMGTNGFPPDGKRIEQRPGEKRVLAKGTWSLASFDHPNVPRRFWKARWWVNDVDRWRQAAAKANGGVMPKGAFMTYGNAAVDCTAPGWTSLSSTP